MVYYNDNELIIRNMEEADARVFTDEEIAHGIRISPNTWQDSRISLRENVFH